MSDDPIQADKGSCLKPSFLSAERQKTCLCSLMLTFLMQILSDEWVVYCRVRTQRHLCSVVEVLALCSCSCVNTREIPGRLALGPVKAVMTVGGF